MESKPLGLETAKAKALDSRVGLDSRQSQS
jgi:hypothetical protein